MEEYPEELRTPPVALAALIGCPETHPLISSHLHSQNPPINTLALPDLSHVHVIGRGATSSSSEETGAAVGGVLKREWVGKHRGRVAAVVGAVFGAGQVAGGPAEWMKVCADIDTIKAVVHGRNSKLVLILVADSTSNNDISEDRILALRKRAEVDAKHIIVFVPNDVTDSKQSLKRMGSLFAELANTYYRDEGCGIKTKLEKKNITSVELSIRYCFKVAVYAEFRRDWAEALRFYEDGYNTLREKLNNENFFTEEVEQDFLLWTSDDKLPAIQRLIAIKTIAEQLHYKISTLLLHLGKFTEAITWFRQHSGSYKKLEGVSEVTFLHWEWLSRQYLAFAELLETSSAKTQNTSSQVSSGADRVSEWEYYPAYYYQIASHYLKEKRACLELTLSMSEIVDDSDSNVDSVAPSVYVGQFARLLEHGDSFEMQSITDEEYVRYALAEAKRFQDSFEIIALLNKSFEAFTNLKAHRMASYCGFEMAKEYFTLDDFSKSKQLFDNIATLYRKEGWGTLLWEVLGYLRECSKNLGSVKDFVEYSFEMAALPISSSASLGREKIERQKIQDEVIRLVQGDLELPVNNENTLKVNSDQPLHIEVDLVSPLRVVLLASVAFHEQMVKPGSSTLVTVSLLSQLPYMVGIDQLEIQFNQSICDFVIAKGERNQLAAASSDTLNRRFETAPSLTLSTNKWLRLTYEVKSVISGKLECTSVIAKLGTHFSICCRAESPASLNDLPLWKFEDRVETFPTKDPSLSFSGQKATQVEEPDPQIDLKLGASGPALVGERFFVPVTISAKGHSVYAGELKVNLVDTKGGGLLSPREEEPFSTDSLHVELLSVAGLENSENNNIQKIQPTFGLICVPFLKEGDSWSCKLEIQWNRPKPIMLYVSLGYSPHSTEINTQKVHVHKSLEIEGKTALILSHQYKLPFRRDPLLLSKIKQSPNPDQIPALPLNETSILIVTVKNSADMPLQLLSMDIEVDQDDTGKSCKVLHGRDERPNPAMLVPGGDFKKAFSLIPEVNLPKLKVGTVSLTWRRDSVSEDPSEVVTKHRLEDVNVEFSPLVVILECPPHAILGNPFTYYIRIENRTPLLQEIKSSLADSQSFVLSGSHNDTIFVLPKSQHIISYKLVPLASGPQPLPKVTMTSARYSAGFQPSINASTVFVYPSEPHFEMPNMGLRPENITAVTAE